jgi:hypothetical protein
MDVMDVVRYRESNGHSSLVYNEKKRPEISRKTCAGNESNCQQTTKIFASPSINSQRKRKN